MKRTFIALPLSQTDKLKEILLELQIQLKYEAVKWVEPENLHITIKFLGDTDEKVFPCIRKKLEIAGSASVQMRGRLTSLDYFSVNGNPSVLYTKISGMEGLEELYRLVGEAMESVGFPSEQRKFRPHLTLGRIKYLKEKRKFNDLIRQFRDVEIQKFEADRMVWFESILRPEGPLYLPLHTCTFSRL